MGKKCCEVTNLFFLKVELKYARIIPRTIGFLKCHENLLSQIMKFFKAPGINCCESKKSEKVTLYDLNRNGNFE